MAPEELIRLFDLHNDQELRFGRIPFDQRLADDPFECASRQLERLQTGAGKTLSQDNLRWFALDLDRVELTSDDVLYLARCGVSYDGDRHKLVSVAGEPV